MPIDIRDVVASWLGRVFDVVSTWLQCGCDVVAPYICMYMPGAGAPGFLLQDTHGECNDLLSGRLLTVTNCQACTQFLHILAPNNRIHAHKSFHIHAPNKSILCTQSFYRLAPNIRIPTPKSLHIDTPNNRILCTQLLHGLAPKNRIHAPRSFRIHSSNSTYILKGPECQHVILKHTRPNTDLF